MWYGNKGEVTDYLIVYFMKLSVLLEISCCGTKKIPWNYSYIIEEPCESEWVTIFYGKEVGWKLNQESKFMKSKMNSVTVTNTSLKPQLMENASGQLI